MAYNLQNDLNQSYVSEYEITEEQKEILKQGTTISVLKLPKYQSYKDELISILNSIATQLDTYETQLSERLGVSDVNKEILQGKIDDIEEDAQSISRLFEILPQNDKEIKEDALLSDTLKNVRANYQEIGGATEELSYRISQIDNNRKYLLAQRDQIMITRTEINSLLQILSEI